MLLVVWFACSAPGQTYTNKTFAGGGLPNGIPGMSARFAYPRGVAVDAAGDVFFVDSVFNAVFRLDAVTGAVSLVAGNGTRGFSGDNGRPPAPN